VDSSVTASQHQQPQLPGSSAVEVGEGSAAWVRAEQVARTSYGRLVALLAESTGDLEMAEDCLADAFARALRVWPRDGVPQKPEAWLLTVARNRGRDLFRSAPVRSSVPLDPEAVEGISPALEPIDPEAIPDRRLALLFVCAHPAIDPGIRAPLMLQTVLGFEAREIARAFVLPPATMAQRLVRAKRRIRDARIPFVLPERSQMAGRLTVVLEAVYGAYSIDWDGISGRLPRAGMAAEAHYLAVTLAHLLEQEPEAWGLAALISLSRARAPARLDGSAFVPLEDQDPARWDLDLVGEGERYLRRAARFGRIGRFQLEAAIQSVHCARATSGETDWNALGRLYSGLLAVAPTLGARVAYATTVARLKGAAAGLEALDGIEDPRIDRFQPAWAARAHLLAEAGRLEEARRAYDRAIRLTVDPAVRHYLERRREEAA